MKTVSIRDAKNRLTELARDVERGEIIVVTRNGRPAFDLTPHNSRRGLNHAGLVAFKRRHKLKIMATFVADDFDDPLPEDFLLQKLPKP